MRLTGALAAVAGGGAVHARSPRRALGRANGAGARPRCGSPPAPSPCCSTAGMTFLLGVAIGLGALLALRPRAARARRRARRRLTTLASPVAGLFVALAAAAWALAAPRERAPRRRARSRPPRSPPWRIMLVAVPAGRQRAVRRRRRSGRRSPAACSSRRCCRRRSARCASARCSTRVALVAAFALVHPAGRQRDPARRARRRPGPARRAAGPAQPGARRRARGRRSPTGRCIRPCATSCARAATRRSQARYHAPLVEFLRAQARSPAASGSRSRSPRTTGRRATSRRRASRSPAAGSASSTAGSARCSTTAALDAARYRALARRARRRLRRRCPTCALDYAGRDEARLVAAGLPYLRPVWRDAHWRVFAVTRARAAGRRPGGARVDATLSPTGVTLRASRAGQRARARALHALVARHRRARLRRSEAPGGMTRVRLRPRHGRLHARLRGSSCR